MGSTRKPPAGATRKIKVDQLKPWPGNPRRGDIDLIADSLERNGQYKPIVVNRRDMKILAGNHTWRAAKALDWDRIEAYFVDVDREAAKRIVLVDNRANDQAGYDDEALAKLLRSLKSLEGTGYDDDALREVLGRLADDPKEGATDPDEVPASPPARVKPGELWELGEHRLLCGNATEAADLETLMGEDAAQLVWTDPPYNVDYTGKTDDQLKILNDAVAPDEFMALLLGAFGLALTHTIKGGPIYVCHPATGGLIFTGALLRAGWNHAQTLQWVKQTFALGRQDYNWQHEPVLYGWRPGAAHRWYGEYDKATVYDEMPNPRDLGKRDLVKWVDELRNQLTTDVTRADKPARSELHPIVKPVELVQHHMRCSSVAGDVVLDPFGGAGTTLIAAETLERRARLLELDAGYADVILARWEGFTRRKAKRLAS